MIRVDEAISQRPEARYSLGLFIATLVLASVTTVYGLNSGFPRGVENWVNVLAPAVLGTLLGMIFAIRPALADYLHTMSHGEKVGLAIVACTWFICASVMFGGWLPIVGLVALQLPFLLTLVTERSYARYYVLCGFTVALSVTQARLPSWITIVALGIFFLVMTVTMAYETFYFGMEHAPPGAQVGISAWLPLRAALVRGAIAAGLTVPILLVTPIRQPEVTASGSSGTMRPRMGGTLDVGSTLLETFLYTMVLILLLIALGALVRWIQKRRRRKQEGLEPESLGTPQGNIERIVSKQLKGKLQSNTPIGRIIQSYERFSEGTGKRGRARKSSETPGEFRTGLVEASVVPESAADMVTQQFEHARYAPGSVTEQQAAQFELVVDNTLSRLTGNLTPVSED